MSTIVFVLDNLEEVKSPIIMKVDAPPEDNIPEPGNQ